MESEQTKIRPDWATVSMLGVSLLSLAISLSTSFSGYGSQLAILEERVKYISTTVDEIKQTQIRTDERLRKMENTIAKLSVMVPTKTGIED